MAVVFPLPWLQWLSRAIKLAFIGFVVSSVVLVAGLRFLPPPTSAFMLHQHIDDWIEGRRLQSIDQRWVDREKISPHAFRAVMASEDQRFYHHRGFDWDAIYKAYDGYRHGSKLRGASTISQQVAKNLFLSPARNFGRKALEVWFTVLIELMWDKSRILEVYLNVAEFGDHLYGIEAASQRYFRVAARNLTQEQAALLAAVLPNPIKLHADRPSAYLHHRQNWILRQMQFLRS